MAIFTPKTEEAIVTEGLIPAKTICDIEVMEATDTVSKSSGNDMIVLKIKVYHENGFKVITDYITFGNKNAEEFKVRRSCDCFGILDAYNSGNLEAADYKNKSGKAKIGIQSDKTGQYPDKNVIGEYCKRDAPMGADAKPVKLDDSIDF